MPIIAPIAKAFACLASRFSRKDAKKTAKHAKKLGYNLTNQYS